MANLILCPICSSEARIAYKNHPGYQQPKVYDVIHCKSCDTSFVSPLEIDSNLYNLIYSKTDEIPGYNRYLQYSENVLNQHNPLSYLARSEDTYWSIKRYLDINANPDQRILEVGCGMGYLTFSINKSGFNAIGLDLSIPAIEKAKSKYGNNFILTDINGYSQKSNEKYDVIIATEVIEHIPDIYEFLNSLNNLLNVNGKIILTTPNKSYYPSNSIWYTDLPPVHLWWFSETSIRKIAEKAGYSLEFTDFTQCNSLNISLRIKQNIKDGISNSIQNPVLDSQGNVIFSELNEFRKYHRSKKILGILGISAMLKKIVASSTFLRSKFMLGHRRGVICAILTKKQNYT
jgi:SAM-dependent methyltransferase